MNKESKLNLNAGDYAIRHCVIDQTYNGLEVHKMLCDAYIAGNNDTLDDEDEKIRHYLMNFVKINDGVNLSPDDAKKALAWLEKQGSKDKFIEKELGCIKGYREKAIKRLEELEKQAEVKESAISQHENKTCEENGNSLTYEDERIRKEIINYFQCQSEEEPTRKEIHNKWIAWLENIPYTIDHEKREGFHLGYKACLERQGEQNPADSYCQENCKGYQETGKCFADGSCKAKREAEQKTNEISIWSEEDSQYIDDAFTLISFGLSTHTTGEVQEWLLSLKGRVKPQWKPSDEQISLLQAIINEPNNAASESCQIVLKDILEQLKKL